MKAVIKKGSSWHRDVFFGAVLFLLSVGFVSACMTDGGHASGSERGNPIRHSPVEISGLRPGSVPAGQYVFNNSKEWSGFWSKHHRSEHHETREPKFNFQEVTLVAVFLGWKPNPGYSVEIAGATEHPNEVVVDVIEYLPSPGRIYVQVIVYPHDAVVIPKTGKEIRCKTSKKIGRP